MAINLVRYQHDDAPRWGRVDGAHVHPLDPALSDTASVLHADLSLADGAPVALADVRLLSPVTPPCRVLCQGANYRQHMIESGMDPDAKRYNLFFNKSDAAIGGPFDTVTRPAHVSLLDYELELGLVIGKAITEAVTITADNLAEYVSGLVMCNDVSARDVQLPQMQWFKGKSYRGFCPVGPTLALLEPGDAAWLDKLELTLTVDDDVRQHDSTANLVFKPAETLTELSTISNLAPGDVVLTGTPHGCALQVPGKFKQTVFALMPEPGKWDTFRKVQGASDQYLQPGQTVRSTIRSLDRHIDLGEQCWTVA